MRDWSTEKREMRATNLWVLYFFCAYFVAMGAELKKQNPAGLPASAWWPGGLWKKNKEDKKLEMYHSSL